MLIAALFVIAKYWKQPKCPSTGGWINKLWYIYTMEYYATLITNELLLHTAAWMSLKNNYSERKDRKNIV